MQSLHHSLTTLSTQFDTFLDELGDCKRLFFERAHGAIRDDVRTRAPIRTGQLRKWQEGYVGSKGGYAAVHAVTDPKGRTGAGAITNYVNSGHVTRNHKTYVQGRKFYQAADAAIEATLSAEMRQMQADLDALLDQCFEDKL